MSGKDHENLTTNFDFICCQNFSMKNKLILGFLFIFITFFFFFFLRGKLIMLVGLYNTHVLNYKRKKNCNTKHKKKHFPAYFQCCYKTPENKIVFQKMFFKK